MWGRVAELEQVGDAFGAAGLGGEDGCVVYGGGPDAVVEAGAQGGVDGSVVRVDQVQGALVADEHAVACAGQLRAGDGRVSVQGGAGGRVPDGQVPVVVEGDRVLCGPAAVDQAGGGGAGGAVQSVEVVEGEGVAVEAEDGGAVDRDAGDEAVVGGGAGQ